MLQSGSGHLSKDQKAALNVKRATATPLWKGFVTLVKYRTVRNYKYVLDTLRCTLS